MARLFRQLRRFLDDRAFLANRRILELLHGIEREALAPRESSPPVGLIAVDAMGADIELPLERPLFAPSVKTRLSGLAVVAGEDDIDTTRLFDQVVVDRRLARSA